MLAKRIIPCLDVLNGRVVKGINFADLQDAGDPVALAKYYSDAWADELVFLDISASNQRRKTVVELVRKIAQAISIPFTVGGGIGSVADISAVLQAGADKVSLNTAAINNPDLITQAAQLFGSQCVVVAIDAKKTAQTWEVFSNAGTVATDLDAVQWAQEGVRRGAGEILLTDIGTDGTREGYNLELTRLISDSVRVPVIASGGAGKFADFAAVFQAGGADAALASSVFHYQQIAIPELKNFLETQEIRVRKKYDRN